MNNLRTLRKEKNLTLRELGEQTNLSFQLLSRIERGERHFTQDVLKTLCDFFSVSTDFMLGRTSEKKLTDDYLRNVLLKIICCFNEAEMRELINYAKYIRSKYNEK